MAEKKKAIHTGHRQRMKEEFRTRGTEGWPDHKILELLLFYAIPQGDVNPLAHELIDRFGSLDGALDALPYLAGGPMAALSRWVAGIPFDLLHCAGNFVLALALERPLYQVLVRLRDRDI